MATRNRPSLDTQQGRFFEREYCFRHRGYYNSFKGCPDCNSTRLPDNRRAEWLRDVHARIKRASITGMKNAVKVAARKAAIIRVQRRR